MRYLWLIAFMLASCVTINAPTSSSRSPTDVYSSVGALSIQSNANDRLSIIGTAFAYKNRLVSAGHVCIAVEDLYVRGVIKEELSLTFMHNQKKITIGGIKIKAIDPVNDICLLEGFNPLINIEPAPIPDIGDYISIIGAPLGFFPTKTEGYIISLAAVEFPSLRNKISMSAPAAPGNSGSPVVDAQGRLIGILVSGIPAYPHLTFAAGLGDLDRFLEIVR